MTTAMPDSYAQQPQGSESTAVIRSVGKCILLLIASGGLWSFAWMYHTTKEVSSRVNQPPPSPGLRTVLMIIPIVNYVMLFLAWQDIDKYAQRARSQSFSVVLYFVLTIIIPFVALFTYPSVQSRLNDAHRAATNGQATDAPLDTLDKVLVGIGLFFWALYILVIVVAVAGS
ncbi:DUF4234 domain-containing protein [Solirubrobacter phytolaccae]|uniref:DUF4234 domain-containing protein n=1 Tax=Solirubrobacter phytolaccae TaxID=1404360 RepID=A0A9X3NB00_9ACTN|nr:hypothetical protein [Solirubrobacter phytolaccae]MDA0183148.1 DUF4234 domain-containing protein [Solirubrobacter phytolaccae]